MITVAQRRTPPVHMPRTRFTALTIGREPRQRAALGPRLRSLGASVVHEAATARTAGTPRPTSTHDVCVLDARDLDVPEELRWIAGLGWRRVLVVAGRPEQVRQAIVAGVRSVVVPASLPHSFDLPLPRSVPMHRGIGEELSEREIQVLQGVAEGRSNRQIGEELCLSALTVKSHLARIARKLGTGDRAEMVAIGIRNGVVA